ncbi:hypothetical protein D9613_000804 [Agrocybe pediades]|uniref:Uncharacterized protein n=1 Tax=Agrocybe pediades TaxID=84607 RepID=A0A8H4VVA4_9AGAR|nr:hypothetical protein D9613_000804 [Agrocybe pediades]
MDVFTSSTSQIRWVSKSTQETFRVEDILSFQEVKWTIQDKLRPLRDVLDAMESLQRGWWFSNPEASNCLSKLFQEKPLTIHIFTALLPDDLYLRDSLTGDPFFHRAATDELQPVVENFFRASELLMFDGPTSMDVVHSPPPLTATPPSPSTLEPDSDVGPSLVGKPFEDNGYFELNRMFITSFANRIPKVIGDEDLILPDETEEALFMPRSTTSRRTHEDERLFFTNYEDNFLGPLFAVSSTSEENGCPDRANPSMMKVVKFEEDVQDLPDTPALTLETESPNVLPTGSMSRGTSVTSVKSEEDSARSDSSGSYGGSYSYSDSRSVSTDYGYYYVRRALSEEEEEEEED